MASPSEAEHAGAVARAGERLEALAERALDRVAQLGERVELGGVARELVVERARPALAHGVHGELDVGVAAAQLRVRIVGGERQLGRARLAGGHAAQRALDLLEGAARAERHEIADGGGLGDRLAAGADVHVDLDEVAGLGAAVDHDERRGLLAQPLELGVDLLGGDLDVLLDALELELLGQRPVRPQRELGRERERLALARHVLEVDARPVGRVQPRLGDRLADPRGQELAHGLLEDLLAAHALQHHVGRHLALAEAGDLGAVDEVPERVPEVVLDLLGIEHHLQPRPAVLKHRRRRPHRLRTLDDSWIDTYATWGVRYRGHARAWRNGRRAGFRIR